MIYVWTLAIILVVMAISYHKTKIFIDSLFNSLIALILIGFLVSVFGAAIYSGENGTTMYQETIPIELVYEGNQIDSKQSTSNVYINKETEEVREASYERSTFIEESDREQDELTIVYKKFDGVSAMLYGDFKTVYSYTFKLKER